MERRSGVDSAPGCRPTPVPCAASRETVRRSALAGHGGYGYCRSHSRWLWGFRLYLLCSPDGLPVGFELAPANAPERVLAAELLERVLNGGEIVIGRHRLRRRRVRAAGHRTRSPSAASRPQRRTSPLRLRTRTEMKGPVR